MGEKDQHGRSSVLCNITGYSQQFLKIYGLLTLFLHGHPYKCPIQYLLSLMKTYINLQTHTVFTKNPHLQQKLNVDFYPVGLIWNHEKGTFMDNSLGETSVA